MSKTRLEDIENFEGVFPKPLCAVIGFFKHEFRLGLKALIGKLDLVTKDEYLVQKQLLDEAYREIHRLSKNGQES